MGLVGNIAEVEYLRKHLIREDTIKFYCDALISDASDGLEVAYNACGTLSHILSDQNHVWPEPLLHKKVVFQLSFTLIDYCTLKTQTVSRPRSRTK